MGTWLQSLKFITNDGSVIVFLLNESNTARGTRVSDEVKLAFGLNSILSWLGAFEIVGVDWSRVEGFDITRTMSASL